MRRALVGTLVAASLEVCFPVSISVRRLAKSEVAPFATFRAAVFTTGNRCEVSRRDTVRNLVERRMDEGAKMLVALCPSGEFESDDGDAIEESPKRPLQSMIGEWSSRLRPPSLDVATMLRQDLDDGSIVGVMEASTAEFELVTHALDANEGVYCTALAVHPRHRRAGVGTKLIELAETEARRENRRALMLHVDRDNADAIIFYQSCGFTKLANEPRYRQFAAALALNPETHIFFSRPVPP